MMGRAFNRVVQMALLPGVDDTQCGFKLFTARAVETIFPAITIDGWAFDLEVLYIARRQRLRIEEIPIEWHYQAQSRVSAIWDSWRMTRDLLKIHVNGRRGVYDPGDRARSRLINI
jgi:dolichyl-phosphate beta-glucosyltransferase